MDFFPKKLTKEKVMLFMLLIIDFGSTTMMVTGKVYKVGDSYGWTADLNSSYADWASSKTFHVHDVLVFEYNATNNNVVQVTHDQYRRCDTSEPLKVYNSGNDSVAVRRGHYYFTSNFSGHCQSGQKLDVRVLKSSPSHATPSPKPVVTSPSPSPSPSTSHATGAPVESTAQTPGVTKSNAATTHDPKGLLMSAIGVTMVGVGAVWVHGCA